MQLSLPSLRRALVVATVAGLAASPAALAAPAKKSKVAKRSASADLVIRDLEADFSGETLSVFADVANEGGKKARRSDVLFALSTDAVYDDGDEVISEDSTRKLRPGKSREIGTEAELASDDDASGSLYVIVCADSGDVVKEKIEANNCASELLSGPSAGAGDDAVAEEEPPGPEEEAVAAEDEAQPAVVESADEE